MERVSSTTPRAAALGNVVLREPTTAMLRNKALFQKKTAQISLNQKTSNPIRLNSKTTLDGLEKSGKTTQDNIEIDERIKMYGTINGQQVVILKDDGCNTNVISRSFINSYRDIFKVTRRI